MPNKADRNLSLRIQALAQGLEEVLEEQYGSRCGFVLIIAPLGQEKTEVQYVSSVDRAQSVDLIKTLFTRWKLELPDVPTHEKQ